MLRSIIDYVKLSASTTVSRMVGGAIVVLPFIIASMWGLAAIYMALRNSYGDVTAAVILAVAFAIIGVIAAIVVVGWIRRQEQLLEERKAEAQQTAFASALLALNPALVLGVGRVAFGLFRRAPVMTAALPIAAGFFLAMASARERRKAAGQSNVAPNPTSASRRAREEAQRAASRRPGNSRDLLH
jgi:DMSO reductase anchor subunit